jgi:hypothetical protein
MSPSRKVSWSLAIALPAATVGTWWTLQDRTDSAAISQTQPQQRKAFSVLRTPPEMLPLAMRATIATATQRKRLGLQPHLAQRVATRTGAVAWIVPGNGILCLFQDRTGAHDCNPTSEAIRHGMTLVVFEPPERPEATPKRYLVLGAAPDRVETVRIRSRTVIRAPVVDNVYALRMARPPRALDASAGVAGDPPPDP